VREFGDAAERVEDPHVRVAHQLKEVAVAGHDLDRIVGARDERRDDVLRLVPLGRRDRDAERLKHLDDDLHLRIDRIRRIVRPRDAVRLVRRDRVDAELRPPVGVERDVHPRRLAVRDEARHEVEEAVRRVDERAIVRADLGDGVVRAVREARRVDEERLSGHGAVAGGSVDDVFATGSSPVPCLRGSARWA